jgi:hopene-associated glycosyltransferase HpnB
VLILALTVAGAVSASAWAGLLLYPARPWDLRPIGEDGPAHPDPDRWPEVVALVPARNESDVLQQTLPALLAQDYLGAWSVVVVDDRSSDGTAGVARALGTGRIRVIEGKPLPPGWVGKVWALEQGLLAASGTADYLLLTDADIVHAPGSLRRLVGESEARGLALNSRMARLDARSLAARLLIPPFVFFFNCLFPMRRVNDPAHALAAAAGGCELVRRDALTRAGGFAAMRGAVIDDVALARRVKALGVPIRLALSNADVVSVRRHTSVRSVWRMVARTAFEQLRRSHLLVAATVAGLTVLFAVPPALIAVGLVAGGASGAVAAAIGGLGWALMTAAFLPTVRIYDLAWPWALTLPLAGALYGGMTVDSALRSPSVASEAVTGRP